MDASTFYGGARLEDHASKRQKVDDATAEEILMRISNGDISDGDFSDDELEAENEENIPANGQVTASTTTAALPARPDATVSSNAPAASTKAEFKWVKKDFAPSDVDCHYNPEVASTCQQPLVYFSKYFTEQIFEDLAEFTNRYVLQRDGAVLATTKEEIKIFFGMLMLMGVLKYPRVRMYWQTATRIPAIADSMGVKRFFKIRGALHISDANEERDPNSQDKFWKVRPLLEAVRSRCLQLVPLEQNSIDEQMVPFTGRIAAKQFVKGKPNPEGVKVFVRCSFDGLAHDLSFTKGRERE
nr:piggyBac transposable element-derived protein 3-like isoform X1 [Rhipicephalus microplus]